MLPSPYGHCADLPLHYYDQYSYSRCYLECVTADVINSCGCSDVYLPGTLLFYNLKLVLFKVINEQKF